MLSQIKARDKRCNASRAHPTVIPNPEQQREKRFRGPLGDCLSALNAGYVPLTVNKDDCVAPPSTNACLFGRSDRGSVKWPSMTHDSPGPAYNLPTSWKAGSVSLRPVAKRTMLDSHPGPGEYSIEKADTLQRRVRAASCVFTRERKGAGRRLPIRMSAASHLGSCQPQTKARSLTKGGRLLRDMARIQEDTNARLLSHTTCGDAYGKVPRDDDVLDADDLKLLHSWAALCDEESGPLVLSNVELSSPVREYQTKLTPLLRAPMR